LAWLGLAWLGLAWLGLAWLPPPGAVGSICLSLRGQSVVLFTVTDMEYPRLGLINIENFDHFLMDAYEQMR
jgi:hypothetical protein